MSTRATIHFSQGGKTKAIVYRHSDGYPVGLGKDLEEFLNYVDKWIPDKRFNDPNYLAAKWVVWDGKKHDRAQKPNSYDLDFLGVGIVLEDPDDIEYRYTVHCESRWVVEDSPVDGVPHITIERI
jgi:hypothetical protein